MNNEILNSGLFQKLNLFLQCGDELQAVIIWEQHHPRVRMKSQQNALAPSLCRNFVQSRNDLAMTYMHSVKGASGDHRSVHFSKIVYGMIYLQPVDCA